MAYGPWAWVLGWTCALNIPILVTGSAWAQPSLAQAQREPCFFHERSGKIQAARAVDREL